MPFHAVIAALALAVSPGLIAGDAEPWWHVGERAGSAHTLQQRVINAVDRTKLREMHETLASEPHMAGTPGDRRTIERLAQAFDSAGLEVEVHDFWPFLAFPIDAAVQIRHTTGEGNDAIIHVIAMGLKEGKLVEDEHTHDRALPIGFNAYSAAGTAEGEVVYANYGTREDFALLRERGILCAGKIVVTRYGRNFRGYKAHYAEQAGAAGLIIYTDPEDSGFVRGAMYPEGGWANETSIQRGSIITLPYPGDPLTPFVEATKDAERLNPDAIALPRIPVQPMGWGDASKIIALMDGEPVPDEWKGGLDLTYRFTGGEALKVTMDIDQQREVVRTANVSATLQGAKEPDKYVIVGCHHDSWGHGASDPLAGMIVVTECARIFGEAAKNGMKPARTIIFAAWGAEEYGIIGSTEWCEANRDMLSSGAVAYINLDMAAMGLNFGSSSSPSLRGAIAHAASLVRHPTQADQSVLATWLARGEKQESMPAFGSLGGGSDHVGFYCHLGIPSASMGGGGSEGTAYHSNYDTITWYKKVVGDDYKSAEMVTQVCAALICELANAPLLPLDPRGYADDGLAQLKKLEARAAELDVLVDFVPLRLAMERYRETASGFVGAVSGGGLSGAAGADARARVNDGLRALEQMWLAPEGLPGRPWFGSLYGASDPYSGYAAWVFPALRLAIEEKDAMGTADAAAQIADVYVAMENRMSAMRDAINSRD
jgi:N-acetylated-alpha-linked acidic dipeptidase